MDLSSEPYLRQFFRQDRERGLQYYREGRVHNLSLNQLQNYTLISANVSGTKDYRVTMDVYTSNSGTSTVTARCSCPRYRDGYHCKHIAATYLAYLKEQEKRPARSDYAASRMLHKLRHYTESVDAPKEPVHLKPLILPAVDDYPAFRFQVGCDKLYIIKNINEFAQSVYQKETVSYGKSLKFNHALENFDERSQKVIRLLLEELGDFTTYHSRNSYYAEGEPAGRYITFQGENFEQIFDLFYGESLSLDGSKTERVKLEEWDPKLTVSISPKKKGASLNVSTPEGFTFFGNQFHMYANNRERILRLSPSYSELLMPFLELGDDNAFFAEQDLPALCEYISTLPESLVETVDPDGLLTEYLPDSLTARYYLDWEPDGNFSCKLNFIYGSKEISYPARDTDYVMIHRNQKEERAASGILKTYFDLLPQSDNTFIISDEDEAISFLSEKLPELEKHGEVYLSDRLAKKRVSPSVKPSLGISVSDGLLTMDIDSGEFPPEELEALYKSLLKKKKYHKLRDGRFLTLDGSGYEKLAEISHMAQLKESDLKNGRVTMPAFRALYLDRVLDKQEDVDIDKDGGFKKLVRNFKAVEDADYEIPDTLEGTLRSYQKTGYQWMKTLEENSFCGILADEMGLGKTVQVITYLLTSDRKKTGKPSIIVCPASLVLNWADELARFAPSLKALIFSGSLKERKVMIEEDRDSDVWVTSYDLLKRDIDLLEGKEFYACVLDEGQAIKNQSTKASKSVKKILSRQRFVLTGTPIENRLSELWNLFDFLMPGYLFSHSTFVEKLEKPIVQSDNPNARKQLSLLVQPFLMRRLKADVLKELPEKTEHVRRIALSEAERKVYQAAAHNALKAAEEGEGRMQILALLTKLRQICCDPGILYENYEGEQSKLTACMELCENLTENNHQVLIFSQFTTMLDEIRTELTKRKISSFTLMGSTPKETRAKLVREFNDGGAEVFLISLKAGGTGLNLVGADTVIHYDPWWNLAAQNQATDRAHRIGQKRHVQVYKLIAQDTIEEKILALQEKKAHLMDAITGEAGSEPLSRDEIMELLSEEVSD